MNSSSLSKILTIIQQQLTFYAYSTWLNFGVISCVLNLVILTLQQQRLRDQQIFSMLFVQIAVYIATTTPQVTSLLCAAIVHNVPN